MAGLKFGRLTVIGFSHRKGKHYLWKCRCDCGKEIITRGDGLRGGHTNSCACFRYEQVSKAATKHGHAWKNKHHLYDTWNNMLRRCRNTPGNDVADYYVRRGVSVCERWKEFIPFLNDMEPSWKEGLSLDRIDNNGPYSPENSRWATKEQQMNNRRNTRWITFKGQTMALADWARRLSIPVRKLRYRFERGLPVDDLLESP